MIETGQHQTVLIVDDSPINIKVLFDFLKQCGYKVIVAISGESAIEKAQQTLPDIILLDVVMLGIDGFETCQRLKASPVTEGIPIIFMTSLSDALDKVKGLRLGAVDYLTKPFQEEELFARIQMHLKISSLTKKLAEQNEILEQRVAERTAKLAQSLKELQQTQLQLVQKEKMSVLGQLMAGLGHEINNPLNFISGNISLAQEYVEALLQHLQRYREAFPNPGEDIEEHAGEIDLEYLLEDLPKMISSLKEGTDRLRQISSSMRLFSRADTLAKVACNIHEGIDSTLIILKHRLKENSKRPAIEVIKEYGDLPPVHCFPGQLNQVFMNLIANAIDALEESSEERSYQEIKAHPNRITIRTSVVRSHETVAISIKDNGAGMSPEVLSQLFDQLFTTKPVGKGTGLGLSISQQIVVEKHQGKLSCISAPGQGAEFVIQIPINPPNRSETAPETAAGLAN
ncbi:sensor histidine kinase [Kamptonema formosum]|uniref:sensor histidine kinase n=1 Tax=Kamptonema formosum TaxID=331992 RepID=UPI0003451509|nr:response regulator [Oscillatoria sp. PCC 10802]